MIAAHMDEIGFIVTHIDNDGFLRFIPLGGFDPKTLTAQRVIVHGKKDVIGVMGSKPIHVMTQEERNRVVPITDYFIDLGMPKKEVEKTGTDLPDKFVNLPTVINYDAPLNEEGDTLLDLIKNPDADLPDSVFDTKEILKEKLREIMGILDDREKIIIEDYFGLSGQTRTLEDIGNDFKLTKERVRQIKEKALRKLRNESSDLFEYL